MTWNKIRDTFPLLALQLDALTLTEEEEALLKVIYTGLDCHDLPSVEPKLILEYVRSSIRMRKELSYDDALPEELFLDYVLPPRVNNEYLDGSRGWLYEQIKDRVQGKTMLDAALEVNYWCFEHATYRSTDDRTIGPLGMCRRAMGRCGEESTLLTAALRAVGIPARQVYVPLWAHCDDNHAWVEFWADGVWHYMGACEPEPVPDVGWFESVASRAMLVRSRVPDARIDSGYRVVNTTSRYADTAKLRVVVRKNTQPMAGIPVQFQIINESRLASIHSEITDEAGTVTFETGSGCLIASAYFDGRLVEAVVDLRQQREIILKWEEGFDPLTEERMDLWELIPPAEKLPAFYGENDANNQRLRECEDIRRSYENTFHHSRWLEPARGNYEEIGKFLQMEEFSSEDKELLLATLSEKDFCDVTCDVLTDALKGALPYKGDYEPEIWQTELLAPRVEHEMLLPIRVGLCRHLKGFGIGSRAEVQEWMKKNLHIMQEYGLTDRRGNALGYVRHGICPESEWPIVEIQICRALGIPATVHRKPHHTVRLELRCAEPLRWRENWSLSKWENGEYRLITYPENGKLEPGSYSLITSRRQIDGTVSGRAERFVLKNDRIMEVQFPEDQTAEKLKAVPLPQSAETAGSPYMTIFLQPGAEPTEHLLREILELKEEFNAGGWPIRLLLQNANQRNNETFQLILQELIGCIPGFFEPLEQYEIQKAMGLGDARLPLALVMDSEGRGVYGCANYHIRSAYTLLRILQMISNPACS